MIKSVFAWLPYLVAGSLIGLWLFVPLFSLALGPLTLRNTELVRWLPLAIGMFACPRAFTRWHWLDIPVVLYCTCPLLAGVFNGLPLADSFWESAKEFSYWWVPYAVGRFWLTSEVDRRAVGSVVLIGAALYLAPTLYEVFYGPQLASWVTGDESARVLRGAVRGDTFKPSVFLSSGFVLTMFYVWAVLVAAHRTEASLWRWFYPPLASSDADPHPHAWLWRFLGTSLLMVVVLLCKSLGSCVLMGVGLITQLFARGRWAGLALLALTIIPPAYIGLRTSGIATTERIVAAAAQVAPAERAGSLKYRLDAEDLVFQSMAGHEWWGYGNWSDWSAHRGKAMVLDGFWLFAWTRTGLVCVAAWLTMVSLPLIVIAVRTMVHGESITADAGFPLAVFLSLCLIDSMFNHFGDAPVMMCVGMMTAWARRGTGGEAGGD